MPLEVWTVATEHDEVARARLRAVVESLGYRPKAQWWGIGGSQEITHVELIGPGGQIDVDAETYVGLTVTGDSHVIDEIRKALEDASLEQKREK